VTKLLEQLELPPLSTRRKIACITLLHKAIHEKVAIPIPSYIIKPIRTSRFHHPKRYIPLNRKLEKREMVGATSACGYIQ
jgi:response regulator of citrate/malate metabolism